MNSVSIGWADYFRPMLVLCGILALAIVAIRFWLPKMSSWAKPANGPIEICARLPLEPRKTLYIIKAANSYMLIASSEAGVQHLTALNADQAQSLRHSSETTPANV